MSRVCEFSGTGPFTGNAVSHSNRKTRKRWLPNIKLKKYHFEELGHTVSLKLSARSIRTIDKLGGITTAVVQAKEGNLSDRLKKVRREIIKRRQAKTQKS